ncbi:MFS transporter [Actinocrinis puniceicyclus]|uniref:MFS transporter n=1 Tax=Actinocrinis puniceicyclus TaxID=977794 RepID=A0A8J8BEB0_9ACTN|nr:MFS transporter [Actinocrinis puniceicyclus]MBS2965335.1 MFS transporter [Actinocrinis puniceicyclus]
MPAASGALQSPPGRRRGLREVLLTERARPQWLRDRPGGWWLAVASVCLGAFMGQLDASIATLTYPALQAQFHSGLASVEWVSLAYLLALVALLVPVGRLSDARGRKLMYLYGFVVFTAASAACGLAPTLFTLVLFRAVQAVGAALLQANSVALVTTSAPQDRLRAALGVQAGAQALGLALGPTLGGVIVTGLGWRWVFFVNVPVGVVAVVAGNYLLPRTHTRVSTDHFDWPGLCWLATASTALLLGISAVSGLRLPWPVAFALFAVAAAASWALARRLGRAARPLIDPALLRTRRITAGLVGALGGYLVLFGPLVLVPVALTRTGTGLNTAGLILTALPAGFAAAALLGDRVLPAGWSDRRRAMAGSAVAAAALVGMILVPLTAVWLAPLLAALGLGLGVFTPANNALVMGAIPARSAGTGGGLVNMTRALGTALGVALVTFTLHAAPHADPAFGGHVAAALLTVLALGVVASNLISLGPAPQHTRSGHVDL